MKKLAAILAGAALLMAAGSAWAIPVLTLDDPGTLGVDVTIQDNLPGDSNPFLGAVTYSGPVGTHWVINVSTGLSPAFGPGVPQMDLNSINGGIGTLIINFNDTITSPWSGPGANVQVGGTRNVPGSATFETWINSVLESSMTFTGSPFSGTDDIEFTPTGSDFIEMIATINHTRQGITSFDYAVTPVPEPGTILLLGGGLLGLGLYGRKRMKS